MEETTTKKLIYQVRYIKGTTDDHMVKATNHSMLQAPQTPPMPPPPLVYHYNLTPEQVERLEAEFNKMRTLHSTDLSLLAAEMAANERDVQAWYHQRVGAWRKGEGLSDCFGQI